MKTVEDGTNEQWLMLDGMQEVSFRCCSVERES